MRLLFMAAAVALAGCATPSEITPYGRDTFLIAVDDAWGAMSPQALQVKAAQTANAYCARSGKVMRVRNTSEQGTTGWTSTSSSLVFSCIAEGDPENTRPELRPAPSTVIEDRRR